MSPLLRTLLRSAMLATALHAQAESAAPSDDAAALRQRALSLASELRNSPFHQPLVIASAESGDAVVGDAYAIVPHEFRTVTAALAHPWQWCEVLILHPNVKGCRASPTQVSLHAGGKADQPLPDMPALELGFLASNDAPDYMKVWLQAEHGPLGTRDYAFVLAATPAAEGGTFVHLRYRVGMSLLSRMALAGYLATAGRDKIGFTRLRNQDTGEVEYVKGRRGAVERNTLRYHLAIMVYLDSLAAPPDRRVEQRLAAWFDASQRYLPQLREDSREEYIAAKRRQIGPPVLR